MTERTHRLNVQTWSEGVRYLSITDSFKYIASGEPSLVDVRDGRKIAVRTRGPEYGIPVVRFHGNPGSSLAPLPTEIDLETIGIRLISFDRPGYGKSDRHEGLQIGDTALDVLDFLNALSIDGMFGLIASSGGVSHALGTAALPKLRQRISGLALLAAKAPWEIGTLPVGNTTDDNSRLYQEAQDDPVLLRREITQIAKNVNKNIYSHMTTIFPDLGGNDWLYFADEGLSRAIAIGQFDGLSQNGDGWYDDILALHKPSGFAVSLIEAPTVIWHGEQDPFASTYNAQWIKTQIPHAELITDPVGAHFDSLGITTGALRWIRDQHIGPERAQQLQAIKATWISDWIKDFNNNWKRIPLARGEYSVDDFEARDAIREGLSRTVDIDAIAERYASMQVLL